MMWRELTRFNLNRGQAQGHLAITVAPTHVWVDDAAAHLTRKVLDNRREDGSVLSFRTPVWMNNNWACTVSTACLALVARRPVNKGSNLEAVKRLVPCAGSDKVRFNEAQGAMRSGARSMLSGSLVRIFTCIDALSRHEKT
jgi:hypothetical protein